MHQMRQKYALDDIIAVRARSAGVSRSLTRHEVEVPRCMDAADAANKVRWGTSGAEKDR